MQKFLIFLSLFLICNTAKATDIALKVFTLSDSAYIKNLETCTPMQKIETLQYGENSISLYQEVEGLKDNQCNFSLGIIEEYFLQCKLSPEKLKIIVSYLTGNAQAEKKFTEIINNTADCHIEGTSNTNTFRDDFGVEFSCDIASNVQMVSDEECHKCHNRTLVEDNKIILVNKPLTYCVLKFCSQGYIKGQDGKCIKQD